MAHLERQAVLVRPIQREFDIGPHPGPQPRERRAPVVLGVVQRHQQLGEKIVGDRLQDRLLVGKNADTARSATRPPWPRCGASSLAQSLPEETAAWRRSISRHGGRRPGPGVCGCGQAAYYQGRSLGYLCSPMRQKSTLNRTFWLRGAVLLVTVAPAWAAPEEPCFEALAATRNYTLGAPRHAVPAPDGKSVFYLRSGPRDTRLGLYQYLLETRFARALAMPEAAPENLSTEEKARRERARMTLTGITDFALSQDGERILVSQADQLGFMDMPDGDLKKVPGAGWIAPRLSPDGSAVAAGARQRSARRRTGLRRRHQAHDRRHRCGHTRPRRVRRRRGTGPPRRQLVEPGRHPPGLRGSRQHQRRKTFHRRSGAPRGAADRIPLSARRHRERRRAARHHRAHWRQNHVDRLGSRDLSVTWRGWSGRKAGNCRCWC